MGFTVNTSDFNRATRALEDTARKNTATYGRAIARQFEQTAKSGAPWTDRHGNARGKLYGASEASGSRVRVQMGGLAPNYKRGPQSSPDYMEYLEFDHGKRNAIVVPTVDAIAEDVRQNFGNAVLKGNMHFNIKRDKSAAKWRAFRRREKIERSYYSFRDENGRFISRENFRYQRWLEDRSVFNR